MNFVKKIIFAIICFFILLNTNVYATAEGHSLSVGEYVYYDPINTTTCNYKNYWTINNQNSTCYRFLVIEASSSSTNTVKLMLDHDYLLTSFNDINSALTNAKNEWIRYSGEVATLTEDDVVNIMMLSKTPAIGESINGSQNGYAAFGTIRDNTIYFKDGTKINSAGFWTNTSHYTNESYAYTVTEGGNNRPVLKTSSRGVRPVIVVNKKSLNLEKASIVVGNLTNIVNYSYLNQKFDGYTYKQMQGFAMANDRLFFYSSNNGNPTKGLLFSYSGAGYSVSNGYYYGEMGHGNDIAYNSKNNKLYVVGPNDYKGIWEFNADDVTSGPTKIIDLTKNDLISSSSAIAYDEVDDLFFVKAYASAIAIDTNFIQLKNSFPVSYTGTGQGFGFNKGFLYVSYSEVGDGNCPSSLQLYCSGAENSGRIFVYNAKYNSDGTISPDFGRLVGSYETPSSIGELESVSFKGDKMYLGYASQVYDSNKTYKVYNMDVNTNLTAPNYTITYGVGTATIKSLEDLSPVDGWTLSEDKKSLTKTLTSSDSEVNICDRYNNCTTAKLKPLDTITFSNNETTYTGSKINVNSATCKSNTEIIYSYYSDSSCSITIGNPVDVGTYYVKATSSGSSSYVANSKCVKLVVNKGNPTITLNAKEATYTGEAINIGNATSKTPNKNDVSLEFTYKYYTDNSCSNLIATGNGVTLAGGAPVNAGTYYARAISKETANLNSVSSSCVQLKINKIDANFSVSSVLNGVVGKTISANYKTNSTGAVTCTSSDNNIATCTVSDGKVNVNGKAVGNVTLTLNLVADTNHNAKSNIKITTNIINDGDDDNGPVVTFSSNGDNNYTKTKNISVVIKDNETYVKPSQEVYYAFSKSNTISPTYTEKVSLGISNDAEMSISIPDSSMQSLTGTYYLWIKGGLLDANDNESVEIVSKGFNFNNTPPYINADVIKSDTKIKGTISNSSLSNILKTEYSSDGINYTVFSNNQFLVDDVSVEKYYIKVTDVLNQYSVVEQNVSLEDNASMNIYIIDNDNNLVINSLTDSNHKNLSYVINFQIPSLTRLVEKYEKFVIKSFIDKHLILDEKNITIFNNSSVDVTNDFKIQFKDNILSISPNLTSDDSFYGNNYIISINTRISDDFILNSGDSLISNKTFLTINDKENIELSVETNLRKEYYSNIPNTALNNNKFYYIVGMILEIASAIIFLFTIKKGKA